MPCLLLLLAAFVLCGTASAETITLGYVAFNASAPSMAEVDITNTTGPNASISPDNTFPVVTPVAFTDLGLTVSFYGGVPTPEHFGRSYFTLAADGLSYDGEAIFPYNPSVLAGNVSRVVLTGKFATTILTLNDGSTVQIDPDFEATIRGYDVVGDGDFALLQATASPFTATPEPSTWLLSAAGMALLAWRFRKRNAPTWVCLMLVGLLPQMASASVHLNQWTTPDFGTAGSSKVWVTGSGFPAEMSNVAVTLAPECNATEGSVSGIPGLVNPVIGSAVKVQFLLPSSLAAGTYFVQLKGADNKGNPFSSDCGRVSVKAPTSKAVGCSQTSDILVGSTGKPGQIPVTAYVAGGNYPSIPAIFLVPLEGPGTATLLATPTFPLQCVANQVTGQVLCSAFDPGTCPNFVEPCPMHFELIEGSTIVQTTPDGVAISAFAINPATDQVAYTLQQYIYSPPDSITYYTALSVSGLQTLTSPSSYAVNQYCGSPGLIFDPEFNQVFSSPCLGQVLGAEPSQLYSFDAINFDASNIAGSRPTTIGEDCATHIAVSIQSENNQLVLSDLKNPAYAESLQVFMYGNQTVYYDNQSMWSAPTQTISLPEFTYLSSGAMVADDSHLGIIEDEAGYVSTNRFGVVLLSPEGGLADYAVFQLNAGTDEGAAGYVNTYTSPNNGKDYAVALFPASNYGFVLAVIDLKAALAAPRTVGTNLIEPGYDLIKNGVVRLINVPPAASLLPA